MKIKIKVKFLLTTTGLLSAGVVVSGIGVYANKQGTQKQWYDSIKNEKFEVRESFSQNKSINSRAIDSNNDFELKLLLNHKYDNLNELSNSAYIEHQNLDFVNLVKQEKVKFKEFIISKETPIVWFYFNNEKDREHFVKKLQAKENIFKFIVYKNNFFNTSKELNYSTPYENNFGYNTDDDLTQYDILNKDDVFRTVNFTKQKEWDINSSDVYPYSVGVLEAYGRFFSSKTNNFKYNGEEVLHNYTGSEYKKHKDHGTFVSSVASGDEGIDTHSKLYFSQFDKNGLWQTRLEELIKDKNVKIINHSYGATNDWERRFYLEESYIVDYLSRKYGVVNVFASGNENNNTEDFKDNNEHGWINWYALSYNSIVVGALDDVYRNDVRDDKLAYYSNYKLDKSESGLAKPFIAAPGSYKFKKTGNTIRHGTSYAAPVITGLTSTLLRIKSSLDNEENYRVPSIKSILSASAVSTNDTTQTKKRNGFSDKYGAGIPDFEKMKEAANNLKTFSVDFNDKKDEIVEESERFQVSSGQTIKASLSWMFNAGLLINDENIPTNYNYNANRWWLFNHIGGVRANVVEKDRLNRLNAEKRETNNWYDTHLNAQWLKNKEALKRQQELKFSDYDLYLQKYKRDEGWVTVERSDSWSSNDELLEYKVPENGEYRIIVKKYKSALFNNSVPDIGAFTYVIKN
ncbi:S8 family serine peptidase [Mycoplasmopsis citelli]|uniref:Subtilase family n=1 Tax=Mycoplasmopsis citelli TaxID=171281 RepID=A0A449B1H7_9BACT|nr:S8 family serine peptidase [Mycoplasmopsis citelli]UUD35928.1 S8 family serine peptidase [Mycoplasmopsis citelli]VEU74467.1 Subtilase family [Mycoplasmopsis citelli]